MSEEDLNIYEFLGGDEIFIKLVEVFYSRVEQDPILRPMFPKNMEPGKKRQYEFLIQYFGGPTIYSDQRGHPRLGRRHAPYPINNQAAQAWLSHMLVAMDEVGIPEPAHSLMSDYFKRAAMFLINTWQVDETARPGTMPIITDQPAQEPAADDSAKDQA